MRYHRLGLETVYRFNADGSGVRVHAFVGEDNVQRWFTDVALREMQGVGQWDPASGYCVYEGDLVPA